ncbi:MAG: hypothetical protein NZ894_05420 [Archaeoglobaceae archaeon]|nr:hypothetical protein [Archaeoglobaceae archaeon]
MIFLCDSIPPPLGGGIVIFSISSLEEVENITGRAVNYIRCPEIAKALGLAPNAQGEPKPLAGDVGYYLRVTNLNESPENILEVIKLEYHYR